MRSEHYEREAQALRLRVQAGDESVAYGGGRALEDMCATLCNMRGGDISKFSRLLAAAAKEMRLTPDQARALAAGCLAMRSGVLASEESRGAYAKRFEMGEDDKSLPFLAKKAGGMSQREQAWVWERLGAHDCPRLIRRLAGLGVSPKALDEEGSSPLSKACARSAANTAALIQAGANPNGEPGEPISPLVRAIEHAFEPGAEALLEGGADAILSRVPPNLPDLVGRSNRRAYPIFAHSKAPRGSLAALALRLAEQVVLSEAAQAAAPGAAGRGQRL